MSEATLDKLLPVHAARERHAQRVYHDLNHAYELALAAETAAALRLKRLQGAAQAQRSQVFEGGTTTAAQAQVRLDHVAVLERRAQATRHELQGLSEATQRALQAAHEARRVYALQVRTGHKLREACGEQALRRLRQQTQRAQQRAEEDFAARWRRTAWHGSTS